MQFFGKAQLKAWLTTHPEGKALLAELIDQLNPSELIHLLAVRHADRIDLYGQGDFWVEQITQICARSASAEKLAEQIAMSDMSPLGRRLFWPGQATPRQPGLIASVATERLTPEAYKARAAYLEALRAMPKTPQISKTKSA